jgi:hypothetical protein
MERILLCIKGIPARTAWHTFFPIQPKKALMKTTNNKTRQTGKPQQDKESGTGITRNKFNQALGHENYNKPDEPTITPPEDVKKKPGSR